MDMAKSYFDFVWSFSCSLISCRLSKSHKSKQRTQIKELQKNEIVCSEKLSALIEINLQNRERYAIEYSRELEEECRKLLKKSNQVLTEEDILGLF